MTMDSTFTDVGNGSDSPVPVGNWRVDPSRSSASFVVGFAGRRVQGRLPLTGEAIVTPSIEDSTAELVAVTEAVRTGHDLVDGLLASPNFLDAETFPAITFRSDLLVRVPTGWRAVGQLEVKGAGYPLACELVVAPRHPRLAAARIALTTRWVLDSTWITTQRIPGLGRRVAMTCSVELDRTDLPACPSARAGGVSRRQVMG
jgi:polyisoprenoid-binding protein YceI